MKNFDKYRICDTNLGARATQPQVSEISEVGRENDETNIKWTHFFSVAINMNVTGKNRELFKTHFLKIEQLSEMEENFVMVQIHCSFWSAATSHLTCYRKFANYNLYCQY